MSGVKEKKKEKNSETKKCARRLLFDSGVPLQPRAAAEIMCEIGYGRCS